MSFNEFAIANVRRENCILNFWHMTKDETIDRIESSYLSKKADNKENEKYYLLEKSEEDKKKSKECKKTQILSMSQEELQHHLEQSIELLVKILEILKS